MGELWPGGPLELPFTFTVDDQPLTIGEISTTVLLTMCSGHDWMAVLTHITDTDAFSDLMWRVSDDEDHLDHDHLHAVATRILGRLSGMYIAPARTDDEHADLEPAPPSGTTGWSAAVLISGYLTRFWGLFAAWAAGRNLAPLTLAFHQLIPAGFAWLSDYLPEADPETWKKITNHLFTDAAPPPWPVCGDQRLRTVRDGPVRIRRADPIPQPPELPITHPSRRAELEVVQAMMSGAHDRFYEGESDWRTAEPV